MIGYIKGNLLHGESNVALLENNGIGYEIICSESLFCRLVRDGGGHAYTYLTVREDGAYLYGFDTLNEKNMFLQLITVSGVGPKMGIGILSGTTLESLAMYIATSDVKSLSKIKGLGKKTAERIIVELREAMQKAPIAKAEVSTKSLTAEGENAVMALMSLGYNRTESTKAVAAALEEGRKDLTDIITGALKYFA